MQTPAFDANAENDVFMVRNIGNQVTNAMGSVEYGVDHLKTPVVLVLGHTGCGAVKEAMGTEADLEQPIKEELRDLKVDKHEHPDARMWADAVVENVHAQVAKVLAAFPDRVSRKELTVVGAIYDFRNDLHAGYGKVVVVDVNGVRDPAKLDAFEKAVGFSR